MNSRVPCSIAASDLPRQTTAWVSFLDVYGFSAMTSAAADSELHRKLSDCAEWTHANTPFSQSFFFSDCMFLTYHVAAETDFIHVLRKCVEDVTMLLDHYAGEGLPLRGGIAYGDVTISPRLLIGPPIVRAVKSENMLQSPLVLLPELEVGSRAAGLIPLPFVSFAPQTFRDGGTRSVALIHPSPRSRLLDLAKTKLREHSLHGPPEVATAWLRAVEELSLFLKPEEDNS